MSKKYRISVKDTNGEVMDSILLENYPTYISRVKEMTGFSMTAYDSCGEEMVVHYNTNNIISISIYEIPV